MTLSATYKARKRLGVPCETPTGSMGQILNGISPECGQWLYAQSNKGERTLAEVASDYIEDAYLEDLEKQIERKADCA